MKPILSLFFLASLLAAHACGADVEAAPADHGVDVLVSINGDVLHGTFLGYDKAGVRWQSPDSKQSLLFQTANLQELRLVSHTPPDAAPPSQSLLLTNGDELTGTVFSLDATTLLLDTWYAGRLAIPRKMLKGIVSLKERKTILYQGPAGVDGWGGIQAIDEGEPQKGRGGSWSYSDGEFVAHGHGSLTRQLKLPGRGCIEFDLDMPGTRSQGTDDYYNIEMWVFAGSDSYIPSITKLNGKDSIILQHHHPGQPATTTLGDEWDLPGSGQPRDKMHFEFRFDNETHSLWIVINGSKIKQWVDKEGSVPASSTLSIHTDDRPSVSSTTISNIRISEWNGLFDAPFDAPAVNPREDTVVDDRQNSLSGAIKSIADGKVILNSHYGETVIPLDHVQRITIAAGQDAPQAGGAIGPGDIRAYFSSRGNVTMEIESWDAKQITAYSPDFGKAVLSPDAFLTLQFHHPK